MRDKARTARHENDRSGVEVDFGAMKHVLVLVVAAVAVTPVVFAGAGCGIGHSTAPEDGGVSPPASMTGTTADASTSEPPPAPVAIGLFIDGTACAGASTVDPMTGGAPCGDTWSVDVENCPGFEQLTLSLSSSATLRPQQCEMQAFTCNDSSSGRIQATLTIQQSMDSRSITYTSPEGECTITQGPTDAAPSTFVRASGTVSDGKTMHSFVFNEG